MSSCAEGVRSLSRSRQPAAPPARRYAAKRRGQQPASSRARARRGREHAATRSSSGEHRPHADAAAEKKAQPMIQQRLILYGASRTRAARRGGKSGGSNAAAGCRSRNFRQSRGGAVRWEPARRTAYLYFFRCRKLYKMRVLYPWCEVGQRGAVRMGRVFRPRRAGGSRSSRSPRTGGREGGDSPARRKLRKAGGVRARAEPPPAAEGTPDGCCRREAASAAVGRALLPAAATFRRACGDIGGDKEKRHLR